MVRSLFPFLFSLLSRMKAAPICRYGGMLMGILFAICADQRTVIEPGIYSP